MKEYFDGTRTIEHDDGSTTYIHYEHEPETSPMTWKETLAAISIGIGIPAIGLAGVAAWTKMAENLNDRAAKRERQKKNKEVFDNLPR